MAKRLLYILLFVAMLSSSSCDKLLTKKTDWSVSLKHGDKKPYGTYLTYETLPHYFPNAQVTELSRWYHYYNLADSTERERDGKLLLILTGLEFYLTEEEWSGLQDFVSKGNEVVLFCRLLDSKVTKELGYELTGGQEEQPLSEYNTGKNNVNVLSLTSGQSKYGYEGRSLQGYFTKYNNKEGSSETADITAENREAEKLGYINGKYVNFLRIPMGNGHITVHAAPLSISNYFLLQPGNKAYLDGIWQTLPPGISHIYWQEYFKRTAGKSDLGVLWRHPATRWAIILGIATLLLYVLFESKRRQRIIPVVEPVENTSVSFVETVGRLYYNKADHSNLAEKMVQHFLEWVRTNYHLNTNEINEIFVKQLAGKSGLPESSVRRMTGMIHDVRMNAATINEEYLFELYTTVQLFYNTKNK